MRNFRRAVRDSLHHWPTIVLATLCSVAVAALWSANIGALFPVIQMTLSSDSLQSSLAKNVTAAKNELADLEQLAVDQDRQLRAVAIQGQEIGHKQLVKDIDATSQRLNRQRSVLARQEWLLSLANAYLPQVLSQ